MEIEAKIKTYTLQLTEHELDGLAYAAEFYLDSLEPDDYVGSDPEQGAREFIEAVHFARSGELDNSELRKARWSEAKKAKRLQNQKLTETPF